MHKRSLPPFLSLIEGEGSTEGGAPPAQPPASGSTPGGEGGSTGQAPAQQQPPAQQPPADADDLAGLDPARLAAMVRDLRKENGNDRTAAKATAAEEAKAELAQTIGKALGIVKDDEAADPAKLAEQLTEREAELQRERVENAAYRAAVAGGAAPERLLDSRAFLAKVHALDPADKTFQANLEAAVTAAIDSDPALRSTAVLAPRRSGGATFTGGGAPQSSGQPASLADAVTAHYTH